MLAGLVLDVELDPLAPVGVDGAGDQLMLGHVSQPVPVTGLENDARGTHELGHHDTLGAVNDEGALFGHTGEVPHEDRLLLDLTGVFVLESGAHEDGRGEGHVPLLAFLDRELRRRAQVLIRRVELEFQRERLAEVGDGAEVPERVSNAFCAEPLERLPLDVDEMGQREDFLQIAKRVTVPDEGASRGHLELLARVNGRGGHRGHVDERQENSTNGGRDHGNCGS